MDLKEIRNQIDEIDSGILDLFLKRMALSEKVAEYKIANNLPILNREREREILKDVMEKSGADEAYAYRLFQTLMSLSKAKQGNLLYGNTPLTDRIKETVQPLDAVFPETGMVACQGVEGANSQEACERLVKRGNIMYVKTFQAVFDAVDSGFCDYGVVPIENNMNGSVRAVYDLIRERNFAIVRATKLNIRHALMGIPGTKMSDIKNIISHEQALGQCSGFIQSLGDKVHTTAYANTAVAARDVANGKDKSVASISSPVCAKLYGLEILKTDIQDSDNNYTRFILVSKKPKIYPGADHMSLIVSCENRAGALEEILSILSARGVNMTKLESIPVPRRDFEFRFYLDLDANIHAPGVLSMLSDLEKHVDSFTFLGNYPVV
ncbi:MAG: prephenate dehydratase [Clostridia bacterium]|nr:prephenate dehydratase [Clostridiales bacterium]MBQ6716409.1 prephenate dehydratase [Clostridia bacterium]